MRLIDADALRKNFEVPHELKCGIQAGMDEYALKCIDEQPTVAAYPWHRVEERLPQSDEIVMIYDGAIGFGCYEKGVWEWVDTFESGPAEVTHWMPLPEPPKEDA